ncbi:MAG: hypothetical protein AAFV33_24070 [Chloroflexota bacterium]
MTRISRIALFAIASATLVIGCIYFAVLPTYFATGYESTDEVEAFLLDSFPVGQVTLDEVIATIDPYLGSAGFCVDGEAYNRTIMNCQIAAGFSRRTFTTRWYLASFEFEDNILTNVEVSAGSVGF